MRIFSSEIVFLHRVIAFALIFIVLIYPTMFVGVKLALLAYLSLSQVLNFIKSGQVFLLRDLIFILAPCVVGSGYCFWGAVNNEPGAISTISVFVAYPLFFGLLAQTVNESQLEWLDKVLTFIFAFAALFVIAYFVTLGTGLNKYVYVGEDANFGLYDGYTKLSFPMLALLNYSGTYLACKLYMEKRILGKIVISLAFFVTVAAVLVTGRRATWIVLGFSVFSYLYLAFRDGVFVKNLLFGSLVFSAVLVLFISVLNVDLSFLSSHLESGFSFGSMDDGGSAFERGAQFKALMAGFTDSPLIGHGLGATARAYGSVRSEDQPWAYELTYVDLLFCLGLAGFAFYVVYIAVTFFKLFKLFDNDNLSIYAVPVFFSSLGFLIASATNPYLLKFDYMFVIFFPLFIVLAGRGGKIE